MPKNANKKQNNNSGLVCRAAVIGDAPKSVNEEQRTVEFTAATETPVSVYDWDYGRVNEVLLMSGVKYPDKVPLLNTHSRYDVADVLGSFRSMRVEGGSLVGVAHFAADQTSADSFGKVKDGHLTDVSVGYRVNAYVMVERGQTTVIEGKTFTGPMRVVTDWTVKEVSLAPIGADENAKSRSLESVNKSVEENTMDEKTRAFLVSLGMRADASDAEAEKFMQEFKQRTAQPPAADPAHAAPATAEPEGKRTDDAVAAERTRVLDITAMCRSFDIDHETESKFIKDGTSLDSARAAVLKKLEEGRAAQNQPVFTVGEAEADKKRAAIRDGILLRAGVKVDKPAAGATDMRGDTLLDMCRTLVGGRDSRYDIATRAMSTSDLPIILGNVANIVMLAEMEKAASTYRLWVGNLPNFSNLKEKRFARALLGGSVDIMKEGEEYKFAKFFENAETATPVKFGKGFEVTVESILNDDLDVITTVPAGLALLADGGINKACYDALLSGKMSDTKTVFHADHKNIATAAAPSIASILATKKVMRKQTDIDGETPLALIPQYLLSPVELSDQFEFIQNTLTYKDAAGNDVKNTSMAGLELVVEGLLDADSTKSWYLAGKKGTTVNLAFVDGFETPVVKMEDKFSNDTLRFKVVQYAVAKAVEYRTVVKNAGV